MKDDELIPTRLSLLRRLKNWDDQDSWQDFFDTYWRFIYHVAIRQGLSDIEAQDVVQETFVTVAKKIGDFQVEAERGSFKAWLVHTARWRIADQFRKRARHPEAVHSIPDESARTSTADRVPDPGGESVDAAWEQEWERNLLETALEKVRDRVSADTFQVFYLHMVKQWSARRVASTVGVKLPQVYFTKYKVYRLVKREVDRLKRELV